MVQAPDNPGGRLAVSDHLGVCATLTFLDNSNQDEVLTNHCVGDDNKIQEEI